MNSANQSDSLLRQISPEAFAMLGAPSLAYIKPMAVEGGLAYGIFSANGQQMGIVDDRDTAFAAARQHELNPVYVN